MSIMNWGNTCRLSKQLPNYNRVHKQNKRNRNKGFSYSMHSSELECKGYSGTYFLVISENINMHLIRYDIYKTHSTLDISKWTDVTIGSSISGIKLTHLN